MDRYSAVVTDPAAVTPPLASTLNSVVPVLCPKRMLPAFSAAVLPTVAVVLAVVP
jgi:hypothetical protein